MTETSNGHHLHSTHISERMSCGQQLSGDKVSEPILSSRLQTSSPLRRCISEPAALASDRRGASPASAASRGNQESSGQGAETRRTYSLTRLHYDVYLSSSESEYPTTLPRSLSPQPITIIGEATRIVNRQRPSSDLGSKKTKSRGSFSKLRSSVSKSKQKIKKFDSNIREKARGTLQRMKSLRSRDDASDDLTSDPEDRRRPNTPPASFSRSFSSGDNTEAYREPTQSPVLSSTTIGSDTVFRSCEEDNSTSLCASENLEQTEVKEEQTPDTMSHQSTDSARLSDAEVVAALVSVSYCRGATSPTVSSSAESGDTPLARTQRLERLRNRWMATDGSGQNEQNQLVEPSSAEKLEALDKSLKGIDSSQKMMKPMMKNFTGQPSSMENITEQVSLEMNELHQELELAESKRESATVKQSINSKNKIGNKFEHLYKILIIGELGTGKTSIIKRYVHQFFSTHYRATIGVDFALKVLHWDANTIIRLQLWDIAGQERFGSMTRVYYKEAVAAFVVFDASRSSTFDAVMKWKNDLDDKVQLPSGENVPCVLLANKCDLEKEGLVTNPERMTEWAEQNGFVGWHETSAKENTGIEQAANQLITKILSHEKSGDLAMNGEGPDMLDISEGRLESNKCAC